MIESMESRRLLSASLEGGVLTVTGGDGPDRIQIGGRADYVLVRAGATISRFPAADVDRIVVDAGAGNDCVVLQASLAKPATLNGGAGHDRLSGGAGDDTLNGGDGNDLLDGGGGADDLSGGDGLDGANYGRRTVAVNVSLDGDANDGAAGEGDNVRADVESVRGGRGDDTLTGSAGPDRLAGGPGNDTISGGGGNDFLDGGAGNDTLNSDAGDDRLNGGAGNDRLLSFDTSADILDGGDGTDAAMTDSLDSVSNVEVQRTRTTSTTTR